MNNNENKERQTLKNINNDFIYKKIELKFENIIKFSIECNIKNQQSNNDIYKKINEFKDNYQLSDCNDYETYESEEDSESESSLSNNSIKNKKINNSKYKTIEEDEIKIFSGKKLKKDKKDKEPPKRPISAFFFYTKERRDTLKKEQPNLDNKCLIVKMSDEWNKMTDSEKTKFKKLAENDKIRYEREKKLYDQRSKEK